MIPAPRFRLCLLLTRSLCRRDPLAVLEAAVRGGAGLVQLREKDAPAREFLAWAREAHAACRALGAPMVVNDSVEIAAASGAEGVHLGQQDLAPADARRILGPSALIGWSTREDAHLDAAARMRDCLDYLGFGPAFPTATKGYGVGLGPARVRAAARRAAAAGLPLLAIGGITAANRGLLGPDVGVAVSSALCAAEHPEAAARAILASAETPSGRTLGRC